MNPFKRKPPAPEAEPPAEKPKASCDICGDVARADTRRCYLHMGVVFDDRETR